MTEFTTASGLEKLPHINLATAEKLGAAAVRLRYSTRGSLAENEPELKSKYVKSWEYIDLGLCDDPGKRAMHFDNARELLIAIAADESFRIPVTAMRADMTLAVLPLFEWRAAGYVPPADAVAASRDALAAQVGGILDLTGGDRETLDDGLRGHFSELLFFVLAMHDTDPAHILYIASPIEEHDLVKYGDLNFNHDAYRLLPSTLKQSVQVKTGAWRQIWRPKEDSHEYHPSILPVSVRHLALHAVGNTKQRPTSDERWEAYLTMARALATPFPTDGQTEIIRRGLMYINDLFESYFAVDTAEDLLCAVVSGKFNRKALDGQIQAARRKAHQPGTSAEMQHVLRTLVACQPGLTALAYGEPLHSSQRKVMQRELAHLIMHGGYDNAATDQLLLLLLSVRKAQPFIIVPRMSATTDLSTRFCAMYAPDGRHRHLKLEPSGSKSRLIPLRQKAGQAACTSVEHGLDKCKWLMVQEALGRPVNGRSRQTLDTFASSINTVLMSEWQKLAGQ